MLGRLLRMVWLESTKVACICSEIMVCSWGSQAFRGFLESIIQTKFGTLPLPMLGKVGGIADSMQEG